MKLHRVVISILALVVAAPMAFRSRKSKPIVGPESDATDLELAESFGASRQLSEPDPPHFPWLTSVLGIAIVIACVIAWPRGGDLPISTNRDTVRISIAGANGPRAFWKVSSYSELPYVLSKVELIVEDDGETRDPMSVTFDGLIANGVETCHQGAGFGLLDGVRKTSFRLAAETPIADDEQVRAAEDLLVATTKFSTDTFDDRLTCSIDPDFVFGVDKPYRHYSFPRIEIEGDVPLVSRQSPVEPLFDIESGLFTYGEELSPTVTAGTFSVPNEAEARSNGMFLIGVLLGIGGGFLTPVFGWLETAHRRKGQSTSIRRNLAARVGVSPRG